MATHQNSWTEYSEALKRLEKLNPVLMERQHTSAPPTPRPHRLQKVLVCNRGEIAKRFFLALHEEEIPSVAVVTDVDRGQSWYEFADETVYIGEENGYTNIPLILAATNLSGANAIYSGYGFLSENAQFARSVKEISSFTGRELIFMGPGHEVMEVMGDKVASRNLGGKHGVPLFRSSPAFTSEEDEAAVLEHAERIGYPVIIKLSSGGGGKGMQAVYKPEDIPAALASCCRIGRELYQDSTFYLEKFITRPVHIEVQVFNDRAVGIRKCAVQRRNQKIIEESGHTFLPHHVSLSLLSCAERLTQVCGYDGCGAGTVEFLIDDATGDYGFMEMNTRLQVEYGVTDQSLGIDLVKWQILNFDGRLDEIIGLESIKFRSNESQHAIECRIYAEDPQHDYRPSPGVIQERILPTFNGVRCDFGFTYGDRILPGYDPMIGKVITRGSSRNEALLRMERALQELYIRGVRTNINQLLRIVRHPAFQDPAYTNNLIPENPSLRFADETAGDGPVTPAVTMPVVLGAFATYFRELNRSAHNFRVVAAYDGILDAGAPRAPAGRYTVTYMGRQLEVEIIRLSLDVFATRLEGVYTGQIRCRSFSRDYDNLAVTYDAVENRIRVDYQMDGIVLRLRDERNKIKYYRMKVDAEGTEEDREVRLLSPFQGSFVCFAKEDLASGCRVKAGEPLLILSAMKMETTLEAPCDGVVNWLLEDGDMDRLQIDKTSDGRIIGKSLEEGEVLLRIDPDADESGKQERRAFAEVQRHPLTLDHTVSHILDGGGYGGITGNLERHFSTLVDMFRAMVQGFITDIRIIDAVIEMILSMPASRWREWLTVERTDHINETLLLYTRLRRLHSPLVSKEGFSFPEELLSLLPSISNKDAYPELSREFETLLEDLEKAYGIDVRGCIQRVEKPVVEQFVLALRYADGFARHHWPRVRNNADLTGSLNPSAVSTVTTLQALLQHSGETASGDSARFIEDIISNHFPGTSIDIYSGVEEEEQAPAPSDDQASLKKKCILALADSDLPLLPRGTDPWYEERISERLASLSGQHSVRRVAVPGYQNLHVFRLAHRKTGTISWLTIAGLEFRSVRTALADAFESVLRAAMITAVFHELEAGSGNRLEIITKGIRLGWDERLAGPSTVGFHLIRRIGRSALRYLRNRSVSGAVIEADFVRRPGDDPRRRRILVYPARGGVGLELLQDNDPRNPEVGDEVSQADRRLFAMEKWPVEVWARECFDHGSMEAVPVPGITDDGGPPVGAAIYSGLIHGRPALFYMKDFRVRGGATGSREGLLYAAAGWLARRRGWPLYVWNDSGGANIREGMVSLNRGGQGFMMNTLLAENLPAADFNRYIRQGFDDSLTGLFSSLEAVHGPVDDSTGPVQVVAVGIGASAGLDVYGSSQATVQIVLDSENSYRVLTGSNVIRSVMGQDISNYDIGGARVLGHDTGTVDLVAGDKIDLIQMIFSVQEMFDGHQPGKGIERPYERRDEKCMRYSSLNLDEGVIYNNVDGGRFLPFKKEFHAAGQLIGGFARFGGYRSLVLGCRTTGGLRGESCILRMRELLKCAGRTRSACVMIFGNEMLHKEDSNFRGNMRPVLDLMDTLRDFRPPRLHIITEPAGLRCWALNAGADAVIFVQRPDHTPQDLAFAKENATMIVSSFEEAFNCSQLYLDLVLNPAATGTPAAGEGVRIPDDRGKPFDMLADVVTPLVDEGSFLEFYKDINRPAGPNLVTGLARLDGRTIGIIGDQPQIKGGGADAPGTEKFRVFVALLNRLGLPLLMLSNSSGFVPGTRQERLRIQAIGAESLDTNILGRIPVVSVVLNQVYGGRQIQAFSPSLRPGIVYLARDQACMAVMGDTAAFDLLGTRKMKALTDAGDTAGADAYRDGFLEDYRQKSRADQDALSTGVVDRTFADPAGLRGHVLEGLDLAVRRARTAFGPGAEPAPSPAPLENRPGTAD